MRHTSPVLLRRRAVAGAIGVSLAATFAAPGIAFAAPSTEGGQTSTTVVSEDRAVNGEVMNYAVNLATSASAEQFATAKSLAEKAGGVLLEDYPEINSFFVQSSSATFAGDLNNALAGLGVPATSIGPTRQAPVTGDEIVVPVTDEVAAATSAAVASGATAVDSQLDDEAEVVPDEDTPKAWGIQAIGALKAQEVDVPYEKTVVGVLDTGVDGTHPDLKDQIDPSLSVGCQVNGVPDTRWDAWQPNHYHGTHVAGTIAAAHNGTGVDGVNPHATLAAVNVANANGSFYPEYVTCGVAWAVDHDFDVTNNSYYVDPWAYWLPNDPTQAAGLEVVTRIFDYADAQGVVNVVAAGNSDTDIDNPLTDDESPNDVEGGAIAGRDVKGGVDIPGMLDSVVTVSATANTDFEADPLTVPLIRSSFSNYGKEKVEIAAPGSSIYSTIPMNYNVHWANLSGTSMASPHVAGVASLLRAIHPDATTAEVKELLYKQAAEQYGRLKEDEDGKEYRGHGLVNAYAAVTEDQPTPTIASVEWSKDGGQTWEVANEPSIVVTDATQVRFRATLTGPVTTATVTFGDAATATVTGSGAFDQSVVVTTDAVDLSALEPGTVPVSVSAEGRNKSVDNDDILAEGALTLTAPVVEAPAAEEPAAEQPAAEEPAAEQPAAVVPAKVSGKGEPTTTRALAVTGAEVGGLLVASLALAGAGVAALRARRH